MARIQLRDTTIYLQDGLTGTAAIDDAGVTAGNTEFDLDTIVLNGPLGSETVPVGARFTVASETGSPVHTVTGRTGVEPTTNIQFTPALAAGVANEAVITFLPQRLEIKIGEGDLSWTESRELIYDRDRDRLDTVRLGQEQPVSVDLAFTFEYVKTQSGQPITPVDAIKNIGGAAEWISSSADACEPYSVDIYVVHDVPCGTDHDQDFLFPDFRYESLDYSMQDATIAVTGQCNATDVVTTRGANLG
jgi:hypothetical protein